MIQKQAWSKPRLSFYGNVEDITEQQPIGRVTKNGGAGDTITVTIAGVTTVVASGAGQASVSSLVNLNRN